MGTAGCQGVPPKAPQIPQGLSRRESIRENPALSGMGVCVFILDGKRSFHADDQGIFTTVLFQGGEQKKK